MEKRSLLFKEEDFKEIIAFSDSEHAYDEATSQLGVNYFLTWAAIGFIVMQFIITPLGSNESFISKTFIRLGLGALGCVFSLLPAFITAMALPDSWMNIFPHMRRLSRQKELAKQEAITILTDEKFQENILKKWALVLDCVKQEKTTYKATQVKKLEKQFDQLTAHLALHKYDEAIQLLVYAHSSLLKISTALYEKEMVESFKAKFKDMHAINEQNVQTTKASSIKKAL